MTATATDPSLEWGKAIAARTDRARFDRLRKHRYQDERWPTSEPTDPWAVYLSDQGMYKTLALDFDATQTSTDDSQRDANSAEQLLGSVGFAPVVASSGGGGFHVFASLATPRPFEEVSAVVGGLKPRWRTLDIIPMANQTTGCIRPPGSPHRSGGYSTVISGSLSDLALGSSNASFTVLWDMLDPEPIGPRNGQPAQQTARGMSDRIWQLLKFGDRENRYVSQSEVIQSIVTECRCINLDLSVCIGLLLDPGNLGGLKAQMLGESAGGAYIERSWETAGIYLLSGSRAKTPRLIADLADFEHAVPSMAWRGKSGATDRTVLLVMIHKAQTLRKSTIGMSGRQMAELAGIDRGTAAASLRRLRDRNLLSLVAESVHGRPHTYELMMHNSATHCL